MTITAKLLRELLNYDAETGVLTWKVRRRGTRPGAVAGYLTNRGYRQVEISGRAYAAHRIVWLYVHGHWPADQIDHINGVRSDNHITNLREATNGQNMGNSKRYKSNRSGYKGVHWYVKSKKWVAKIGSGGNRRHLGYFNSAEEAHRAYTDAARERYGEFARP